MNQPALHVCESTITSVTVYARGARVTRRVSLPAQLPASPLTLSIDGVSPLAEVGSVQAVVAGRTILGIRTHLEVPRAGEVPGRITVALRDAELALAHLSHRMASLKRRRAALMATSPHIEMKPRRLRFDVERRVADAQAAARLLDRLTASCDAALAELQREHEAQELLVSALRVEAEQARGQERSGEGHPTRTIALTLAAGEALRSVEISYTVAVARWWPAYSVWIGDTPTEGRLSLDAFVAQGTLEDWTGVDLTLSTADLLRDVALPELRSWRIGKRREPRSKGYRDAPEGLDALFLGFDASQGPKRAAVPTPPPKREPSAPRPPSAPVPGASARSTAPAPLALSEAPHPAPQMVVSAALPERAKHAKKKMRARSKAPRAPQSPSRQGAGQPLDQGGALVPADAWQDFDGLVMAPIGSRRRGRLERRTDASSGWRRALPQVEQIRAPKRVLDPLSSRGVFDHIYHASAPVDVPATATAHRVSIVSAEVSLHQRARTVPVEAPEVYREVHAINSFGTPLLAGPLDVYMDGSLVTTARMPAVDKGGALVFGLGVEERLRVARNVHAREESAGIFGGGTEVVHTVNIELASALGVPFEVDVLERVPVTDDDEVEVRVRETAPRAEAYDQAARGEPIRGGLRWRLIVPASGKVNATLTYVIGLSAKREIQGGNHRG